MAHVSAHMPVQPTMPPPGTGRLVVHLKSPPGLLGDAMTSPRLWLNGNQVNARWGPATFDLPPGRYEVTCAVKYLYEYGRTATVLDVAPGRQAELYYTSPAVVFVAGALGPAPVKPPGQVIVWISLGVLLALITLMFVLPNLL